MPNPTAALAGPTSVLCRGLHHPDDILRALDVDDHRRDSRRMIGVWREPGRRDRTLGENRVHRCSPFASALLSQPVCLDSPVPQQLLWIRRALFLSERLLQLVNRELEIPIRAEPLAFERRFGLHAEHIEEDGRGSVEGEVGECGGEDGGREERRKGEARRRR
jgi:hypothetical protein